ncbi:MAG: aminotransferase class I/II-fold pyridoxal phosphate-dependent enzyme [Anaerolineae bacterium]|nr:aminotransferase class I/II-fold pyridoxal phosphate-dependent enzyme [Anaerolineae bacterium]
MPIEPFKLERYYAKYEFSARYMLSSSDCESRPIGEILAFEPGAAERLQQVWLGYTEVPGAPELREAIAALYTATTPGQIHVHTGAEEAIYTFFNALVGPGDHVIVQTPCYQAALSIPRALGCAISAWPGREVDGWMPDLDALAGLIQPNTKALYLCSPANPTGFQFSADAFRRVIDLAEARGIVVFSDEVYRELEHDPALRLPAACDLGERAVSLGVMSKAYGLAGLRIGWAASQNTALLAGMASVKDYLSICASAPSEFLAAIALRHREILVRRNLGLIRRNLVLVDAFLAQRPDLFSWIRPQAGPIGFVKYRGAGTTEDFCQRVVEGCSVLLAPGELYERPGYFRLGFGRASLGEALATLEMWIAGSSGLVR